MRSRFNPAGSSRLAIIVGVGVSLLLVVVVLKFLMPHRKARFELDNGITLNRALWPPRG